MSGGCSTEPPEAAPPSDVVREALHGLVNALTPEQALALLRFLVLWVQPPVARDGEGEA
jgi:hypothetical protein